MKTIDFFPLSLMNYSLQQFILLYSYESSVGREGENFDLMAEDVNFFVVCLTFDTKHIHLMFSYV
jgi:hypothetical protein